MYQTILGVRKGKSYDSWKACGVDPVRVIGHLWYSPGGIEMDICQMWDMMYVGIYRCVLFSEPKIRNKVISHGL